ncbi:hypothetical protein FRC01_008646 [Tulasnella sp. 417]|nr:hypothetical protein FRC01_008646 [Tulasnella sp. 417]
MSSTTQTPLRIESKWYGYDNARMEIDLAIPVLSEWLSPENLRLAVGYAADQFIKAMADAKSRHTFGCEFCGKPARENYLNIASYLHLPPKGTEWNGHPSSGPFILILVHTVCKMSGECGNEAKKLSSELAQDTGTPETHIPEKNPVDETIYPLFGSCANCKTDDTAKKTLSVCVKCKTAQYCGKDCQRADWPRHKESCKWVIGSRWFNENGGELVYKDNPDRILMPKA